MIEASTQFMVEKPINRIWQVQQFQSGRDFRKRQPTSRCLRSLDGNFGPPVHSDRSLTRLCVAPLPNTSASAKPLSWFSTRITSLWQSPLSMVTIQWDGLTGAEIFILEEFWDCVRTM